MEKSWSCFSKQLSLNGSSHILLKSGDNIYMFTHLSLLCGAAVDAGF